VLVRLRTRYLLLIDIVLIFIGVIASFVIRYEALWNIGPYVRHNAYLFVTILLIRPLCYYLFGLYRCWWRYASIKELITIVQAVTVGSLVIAALVAGFLAPQVNGVRVFSRSVLLLEWMLNILAIGNSRIVLRLLQTRPGTYESRSRTQVPTRRALVMGAGDAGALIVREMQNNPALGYLPVGFLDDAPHKRDALIYGVQVLGTRQDIPRLVAARDIDEVIIAMPTAPGSAIREVRAICAGCHVPAKTIPGLYELLGDMVSIGQIREVQIEDLLRREPVRTDLEAVEGLLSGAVVLVTGAGGSIGSELCRQILARHPKELLLLGHGENSIYNVLAMLRPRAGATLLTPLIADVRDAPRLERLLQQHRPQVIFHAAAHKHVPLMESNPEEAFTTNVLGTQNLLLAAHKSGAQRLVMISSDKAVNPVNIMGASKYLAELMVQSEARASGAKYAVVRFGNVLGSRGSVVPLFEEQIAAGGPVTITHPDMTRYFMTIPEAVQLVLQAAVLGQGGDILVLDMGEQIRILDLARDLISLSGLEPGSDIAIAYTGVRPGEKLCEELFGEGEEPVATAHAKILAARSQCVLSAEALSLGVQAALAAARQDDTRELYQALQRVIPSFCPACNLPVPELPSDQERVPGQDDRACAAHAAAANVLA
jgi:FlaA1/EpsC-like NDP-sugar epimerase